jgi:hypothetical protein
MKRITFAIYFFLAAALFGNDYYYYRLSGGTIVPANDNETDVELVDEVIIFELFDDYYTITVDFNFYNHGEAVNLLVGFPYAAGIRGHITYSMEQSLFDFQSWVNGSLVETRNTPIDVDLSDQRLYGAFYTYTQDVDYAYTKDVFFPSQQNTRTRVMYKARYGSDGGIWLASYLYGSGKGWHNCIGKIEVIIKNNSRYWTYGIKAGVPSHNRESLNNENLNHRWNNNDLVFVLENIEPDYNDTIEVLLDRPMFDFSMFRPLPRSFDYWSAILRPNQLWYLTGEQLRILRNLFYALHGYNFRDTALLNYFSSAFGSYEVNRDFNENILTETERRNIEIIQREELKRTDVQRR